MTKYIWEREKKVEKEVITINPKVRVLSYTQEPLTLMGKCASVCWDSEPSEKIGKHCMKVGHDRVTEYADVTLEISGYSARVVREVM